MIVKLTNETVARQQLPRIRKEEMLKSAEVLNLRYVYFLEQVSSTMTIAIVPRCVYETPHPLIHHWLVVLISLMSSTLKMSRSS